MLTTPYLSWCWPHPATPFTHQDEDIRPPRQASSANTTRAFCPPEQKGKNHCTFHHPTCLQVGPERLCVHAGACVRAGSPKSWFLFPRLEGQCAGGHSEEGAPPGPEYQRACRSGWCGRGSPGRSGPGTCANILVGQVEAPAAGTGRASPPRRSCSAYCWLKKPIFCPRGEEGGQ